VKVDIEEEKAERLSFKVAIPATIVAPNSECFVSVLFLQEDKRVSSVSPHEQLLRLNSGVSKIKNKNIYVILFSFKFNFTRLFWFI